MVVQQFKHNATGTKHFKMVKIVNFMLYILYHNENFKSKMYKLWYILYNVIMFNNENEETTATQ